MGSCSSTRVVVLLMILVVAFSAATVYSTVMYDHKAIVINGQRRIMFSGSIHYPRSTPEMWPDLIQMRVLGLFGNLCPGSDLTHFQLPPLFNMPKSQLQCYREGLYGINKDMIRRCARGKSSLKRWSIIAAQLPGRTDNDIKNYWNTKLKKKLLGKQKNQGTNSSSNPEVLSSTAMERMQLHMHLQDRHGPFTFYNSPLLWPRLPQQCQHNAAIALTGSGSLAIPVDRGEAEEADANLVTGLPPYFENLNENYISSGCATSQEDMNVLDQEVNGVGNYAENVFWWETSGLDENCVIGFGI